MKGAFYACFYAFQSITRILPGRKENFVAVKDPAKTNCPAKRNGIVFLKYHLLCPKITIYMLKYGWSFPSPIPNQNAKECLT